MRIMLKPYTPIYTFTHSIIKILTQIATHEGELRTKPFPAQKKLDLMALSNIDAVHFSTKLEGNALTHDQVTEVLGNYKPSTLKLTRDLKEVLNYSKARAYLFEHAKKNKILDSQLVLETHKILLNTIVTGKLKGHYRQSQNVIRDAGSRSIVYLPPEPSDVKPLMTSLLNWVHKSILDDVNPCIIAAIFHYYFVTIHPFIDGNGRSARLLTNYILLSQNITLSEYAALEKQHEINRKAYYLNLNNLQGPTFYDIPSTIDLTPWIEYWLSCLEASYQEAIQRCSTFKNEEKTEHLDNRLQKATSLFRKHTRLTAAEYQVLMGLGRTQAISDLNQLMTEELIEGIGNGRSKAYRIVLKKS